MRIIVIGPTQLTRHCLEALIRDGKDEIVSLYTLDNTVANAKSRFVIMDDLAEEYGIKLYKVKNINDSTVVEQIRQEKPDVIFQIGWSQIFVPEIIRVPKKGCIGLHAALLPKDRGAASLNWALLRGEKKTGVTLFYMTEKADEGYIISQKEFDIDERDDINTLHAKSDLASVELLMENIEAIRNDAVKLIKQNNDEATYTKRRKPEDGLINWDVNSKDLYNWIRALTHPFPGAFTFWKGKKIYIWSSEISSLPSNGRVGEVVRTEDKNGIFVNTKDNVLILKRLQLDNGVEIWADDFAKKYGLTEGDVFE